MKTSAVVGIVICGLFWGNAEGGQKAIVKVTEGITTDRIVELRRATVISHNVTSHKISGEGILLKDLTDDIKYNLTVFMGEKRMNIPFPLKKGCEFIEHDPEIMKNVKLNSNIPETCPIPKGKYVVNETNISPKSIPPMLPAGCYKVIVNLWKNKEHLQDIVIDAAISDGKGNMKKKCDV